MPIREWINSNRSRSYVLSHSTCDTVLKKYSKSCTYYDIATPKRKIKKKLEKQRTAVWVSEYSTVCMCVNIVRWPSQYFLSNSQHWTESKMQNIFMREIAYSLNGYTGWSVVVFWYIFVPSLLHILMLRHCSPRLYNYRIFSGWWCWCYSYGGGDIKIYICLPLGSFFFIKIIHNCGRVRVFLDKVLQQFFLFRLKAAVQH